MAVSACGLPDALHVAVLMAGHSFEITPVEGGGHLGFRLSDLDESLNGTCGNSDIDLPATGDHGHGHNGSEARHPAEHVQAWMHVGKPRQRRTCTKTVEVLVVNDFALWERSGSTTESFSLEIFNAMASLYAGGGFACSIQLRLVGQLTFRHGTPSTILQRDCGRSWYYADVTNTAANNACCAASSSCDASCPEGTMTRCIDSSCTRPSAGCVKYGGYPSTCGARGRTVYSTQDADGDGVCDTDSTSSDEVHTSLMLSTFGDWLTTNNAALESIYGQTIDNALLFSGFDFASSTVGLAGLGTMCADTTKPASSINQIRTTTAVVYGISTVGRALDAFEPIVFSAAVHCVI